MDTLGSIEVEYIKNLQKQVCLLEFETSYLYPLRIYILLLFVKSPDLFYHLALLTIYLENCVLE